MALILQTVSIERCEVTKWITQLPMITSINRDTLYLRHHLSHEQIDDVLGEARSIEYPEAKAQHLGKLNAFMKVSYLFDREGLSAIPLKGPLLSYRLYDDPLYRVYNDLDFLISFEIVPRAIELLKRSGFKTLRYNFPPNRCRRHLLLQHACEIQLYNPDWDALVELHWNLFNIPIIKRNVHDSLIKDSVQKYWFRGINFSILSVEFELLYLIIHGGFHGWGRLKWLLDIKVFLDRYQIDKERFSYICSLLKAQRQVSICNVLLKLYFSDSKHLPISDKISERLISVAIHNINLLDEKISIQRYLSTFLTSWHVSPSFNYKINLLKQLFFATDLVTVKWIPCSSLFFYILSPFWKLMRGFRN